MGGQTGFGPVQTDDDDDDGQFFHADWEARVYALVRVLQRHKVINQQFDEWLSGFEQANPEVQPFVERTIRPDLSTALSQLAAQGVVVTL